MITRLRWKVEPAPVGRYRSFEVRGWPTANFRRSDKVAALITSEDAFGAKVEYVPAKVKADRYDAPLRVWVAEWHHDPEERKRRGAFTYRRLRAPARNLDEAKFMAEAFLTDHPQFWPEEELDDNITAPR